MSPAAWHEILLHGLSARVDAAVAARLPAAPAFGQPFLAGGDFTGTGCASCASPAFPVTAVLDHVSHRDIRLLRGAAARRFESVTYGAAGPGVSRRGSVRSGQKLAWLPREGEAAQGPCT